MKQSTKDHIAGVFAMVVGLGGYNMLENFNDSMIESAQKRCQTVVECRDEIKATGDNARDIFMLGMVGMVGVGLLGANAIRRVGNENAKSGGPDNPSV